MKNPYIRIFTLSAFLFIVMLAASCKKAASTTNIVTIPLVTTPGAIINATSTTAQSGGIITSDGGGTITANGVCYSSSNKTPGLTDSKTTDAISSSGAATTTFTSNLTNLTPNTLYYVRAYATNSAGTGYGSVIQFTTNANLSAITTAVTTFAGSGTAGYADGSGVSAQFNNPQGVTVNAAGSVYVSDSFNNNIRLVTAAGAVSTFAGSGTIGNANGIGTAAQFYAPKGSVFDSQGNLYVADFGNNVIRKITPAGVSSTFAGNGAAGYIDESNPLYAEFDAPAALAIDATGNLYVADRGNNLIRKITPAGVVSTLAGTKTAAYIDGTGTGASFNYPNSIVIDASGNLYVADQNNAAIRKVTSAGVVTTLVGGPSQLTLLNLPSALAIDKSGNLYIADEGGRILEYTTTNILYILAGTANVSGFVNGAGTSAQFSNPQSLAIDAGGNIYVADQNNNCIRKIVVTLVP